MQYVKGEREYERYDEEGLFEKKKKKTTECSVKNKTTKNVN